MKWNCSLFSLAIGCTVIASCSVNHQDKTPTVVSYLHQQEIVATTNQSYPKKDPTKVTLYQQSESPHTAYRVIGVAKVNKNNVFGMKREDETMKKMMKSLAASIGGDGVIEYTQNENNIQGNVIVFQKILL